MATFILNRKLFAFNEDSFRAMLSNVNDENIAKEKAYQRKYPTETSAYISKNSPSVVNKPLTPSTSVITPKSLSPKSKGIFEGLKNTWKSGIKGKAGILATGAGLIGAGILAGKASKNKN